MKWLLLLLLVGVNCQANYFQAIDRGGKTETCYSYKVGASIVTTCE